MSDAPINLGDKRAAKRQSGAAWTPVEMLRSLLTDIEQGRVEANVMVVAYVNIDGGACERGGYRAAAPDAYTAVGCFEYGRRGYMDDSIK